MTAVASGSDGGTNPALGLIRLAVSLAAIGAAPPGAHVRIWACGREKEKDKPQVGAPMVVAAGGAPRLPPTDSAASISALTAMGGGPGSGGGGKCGCNSSAASGEGCACGGADSKACSCNGKGAGKGKGPEPARASLRVTQGKGVLEIFGLEAGPAAVSARVAVAGAMLFEASYSLHGRQARSRLRFGPAALGAGHELDVEVSGDVISGTANGRPFRPISRSAMSLDFLDGGPPPEWQPVAGALDHARALLSAARDATTERSFSAPRAAAGRVVGALPLTPTLRAQAHGCPKRFQCVLDWYSCFFNIPPCNSPLALFCFFYDIYELDLCQEALNACLSSIVSVGGAPCDPNLQNCCDGANCVNGRCCWGAQHDCHSILDCCDGMACYNGKCCIQEVGAKCSGPEDCCSNFLVCAGEGRCYPAAQPHPPVVGKGGAECLPDGARCDLMGQCIEEKPCYEGCCNVCFQGSCAPYGPGGCPGSGCGSDLDCQPGAFCGPFNGSCDGDNPPFNVCQLYSDPCELPAPCADTE
jgi:hypothetical protein